MQGMFVKLECSRVIFVTSLWKMHVIVCSGMFLKNLSATMHMTSFSEVKSWISPAFFTAEQFCIFEKILFQQKVSRYARVQYTKKKRELLNQLNFPPCSWLWCEREIRIQNCLKHFISEARENQISCSACVPRRIWNLKQKKDKKCLEVFLNYFLCSKLRDGKTLWNICHRCELCAFMKSLSQQFMSDFTQPTRHVHEELPNYTIKACSYG